MRSAEWGGFIPHSAFRTPHFLLIPHSALRIPHFLHLHQRVRQQAHHLPLPQHPHHVPGLKVGQYLRRQPLRLMPLEGHIHFGRRRPGRRYRPGRRQLAGAGLQLDVHLLSLDRRRQDPADRRLTVPRWRPLVLFVAEIGFAV